MITQEEFDDFMEAASYMSAGSWDEHDWVCACNFAGINYYDYDDPNALWIDLCKAWSAYHYANKELQHKKLNELKEYMKLSLDEMLEYNKRKKENSEEE